jgi:hypothetical protein
MVIIIILTVQTVFNRTKYNAVGLCTNTIKSKKNIEQWSGRS